MKTCDGCATPLTNDDEAAALAALADSHPAVGAAVPARWWWCPECSPGAVLLLTLAVASERAGASRTARAA